MQQTVNPLRDVAAEVLQSYRPRTVDFRELDKNLSSLCGDNLRQLRVELGWTQEQASQNLGICVSQYRKYERGEDFMKMGRAAILMQRTGVPFTFLFARSRYTPEFGDMAVSADMLPFQILCGTADDSQFHAYALQVSGLLPGADALPDSLFQAGWPQEHQVVADIDSYYEMVARGLRNLRAVLGLTQENLADLLNLNVRTYTQYERERCPSQFNILQALHLWIATGVRPLWATYGTAFYEMRVLQHRRMRWLLPYLQAMTVERRAGMAELARLLRAPVFKPEPKAADPLS